MNRPALLRSILALLALCSAAIFLGGCVSDETAENRSSQPWNSPQNWEGGLPNDINRGR